MVSEIEPNLEERVEEPILLNYANVNKEKRWYNPLRYPGALAGIGYGLVWPALVLSYVGIPGFSNIYDKFLPHESLQDNFIGWLFRDPSDFIGENMESCFSNVNEPYDRPVIFAGYIISWGIIGGCVKRILLKGSKLIREGYGLIFRISHSQRLRG